LRGPRYVNSVSCAESLSNGLTVFLLGCHVGLQDNVSALKIHFLELLSYYAFSSFSNEQLFCNVIILNLQKECESAFMFLYRYEPRLCRKEQVSGMVGNSEKRVLILL